MTRNCKALFRLAAWLVFAALAAVAGPGLAQDGARDGAQEGPQEGDGQPFRVGPILREAKALWRVQGAGWITDASHPERPGDFWKGDVSVTLLWSEQTGEARMEVRVAGQAEEPPTVLFSRRGRTFGAPTEWSQETGAEALGDVSAAAAAALHPALTDMALHWRAADATPVAQGREADASPIAQGREQAFAWNDVLWRVRSIPRQGVTGLTRSFTEPLLGDGEETVHYTRKPDGGVTVSVWLRGREIAHLEYLPPEAASTMLMPPPHPTRDPLRRPGRPLELHPWAPGIYAIELEGTRVFVAEFEDHLVVFEGAVSAANCEEIADLVKARFKKPVTHFAFSHIHGQYIGGLRAWIHEGATILVPPTTQPLVEQMAAARHTLLPDRLERDRHKGHPRAPRIQVVEHDLTLSDARNEVRFYNIASDHTDEYLIAYFPRTGVLLSGDLFFYRTGKPVIGRSRKLCETAAALGLDVKLVLCTWPLGGQHGTQDVIAGELFQQACTPPQP